MMYCLPVSPTVTTRISDAVPMTMPSAVKMNRILLVRNVWTATLRVSPKTSFGYGRPLLRRVAMQML